MATTPPTIFAPARRLAARRRARALQRGSDAARFVLADMVEDIRDRLAFVRHEPRRALVVGDWTGELSDALAAGGAEVIRADPAPAGEEVLLDEERPYPFAGFDFIASLATLDTVNDLPGALIHIRAALAPGGLAIASFAGAGSLPALRAAMLAADRERPAPHLHPMVDVRAGAQLLQRAGWADPVVDSHSLKVRYSSLGRLLGDLRAQGLGNVLASAPPPLSRAQLAEAEQAFAAQGDTAGRVTETFEILTLSGRRRQDR
ncbi:methyltransferase [Altererythrobacter sp. B11]|uniref:methyltransferase domain-containing protein n=1 Tax=Altererythrobacter sp. B11 TaxID=2060312 RepID=UPI000DC6DC08|nr:methyltransferase domain-containing protein [Altererythrobacter sp. B11]BBC73079.1 methyltransferase [Altererythrobacter sp. B11]